MHSTTENLQELQVSHIRSLTNSAPCWPPIPRICRVARAASWAICKPTGTIVGSIANLVNSFRLAAKLRASQKICTQSGLLPKNRSSVSRHTQMLNQMAAHPRIHGGVGLGLAIELKCNRHTYCNTLPTQIRI